MAQVYHVDEHSPYNIPAILRALAGSGLAGQDVMVKLTMGEKGNKWFVKPPTVLILTDELKALGRSPVTFNRILAMSTNACCGGRSSAQDVVEGGRWDDGLSAGDADADLGRRVAAAMIRSTDRALARTPKPARDRMAATRTMASLVLIFISDSLIPLFSLIVLTSY
jgi:hypothetical protein